MKRLDHISLLKIFAFTLVFFGHGIHAYIEPWLVPNPDENSALLAIFDFIYTFHVPLFIAISGFLFALSTKPVKSVGDFFRLLGKKILRLLVPYYAVGLFIMYPLYHFTNIGEEPITLLGVLLGPDAYHLWFLQLLFVIALIVMIVRPILDRFPLVILGATVLLHIFAAFGLFNSFSELPFQIGKVPEYLIYFLAGYHFLKEREKVDKKILESKDEAFVIPWVFILGPLLITTDIYIRFITDVPVIKTLLAFGLILAAYAGALLICDAKKDLFKNSVIKWLDKNNFTIYLLHDMAIMLTMRQVADFDMGAAISLSLLVALVVSVPLAEFISRFKITRFLVGGK